MFDQTQCDKGFIVVNDETETFEVVYSTTDGLVLKSNPAEYSGVKWANSKNFNFTTRIPKTLSILLSLDYQDLVMDRRSFDS
jgi:hypothetical protein